MELKTTGGFRRNLRFALVAVVGLLQASPSSAATLRVPLMADIGTFDPDNGFEIGAMSAINNVYEGLVQYEPGSAKVVPRLARSWQISPDGKDYTFQLEGRVVFHDGGSMTATDVVRSLERRWRGDLALSYFLSNVESIVAIDPLTVRIRLKKPQPSFLDSLASPWGPKVIGPRSASGVAGAATWLDDHADGTGPFELKEFNRSDRYVLTRNDRYWGPKPYFDEVLLPVVPDVAQQILKLRAGAIDLVPTGYPFAQLDHLPAGVEVTASASTILYTLFPRKGSPLDDADVRKAVLAAINPVLWVEDAFGKYGSPAKSIFPEIVLRPEHPIVFPVDIEAAKETIARQGEITLTIGLHSAAPGYQRIADLLITQLAAIGVKATSYALPPGAAFQLKDAKRPPDLLLTIAGPDAAHPENQARAFFTRDAPVGFFGRWLPEADNIFDEAGSATDLARRNKLYEEAGRMIFDSGIAIPLVEVQDVVVHSVGLRDLGLRAVYPPGNVDFGTIRR